MARLIAADALIKEIDHYYNNSPFPHPGTTWLRGLELAMGLLLRCPTVDAVEVVRCKDCKHSVWDEENEMWKCVESAEFDEDARDWFGFYEYHNGDFFCTDGERKDND